jgi:hypothetical protein
MKGSTTPLVAGSSIKLEVAQDEKSDIRPFRGLMATAFLPLADLGVVAGEVGDGTFDADDVIVALERDEAIWGEV